MKKEIDEKALFFSRRLREAIGPRVRQLVLYGSRARGDAEAGSDYDFLLVVDKVERELKDKVLDTEVEFMNTYDELSACIVYGEKEWEWRKNSPLGINIAREGVAL